MKLSPKEKAEELVKKCKSAILSDMYLTSLNEQSKNQALFSINEVLEATKRQITVKGKESYVYHPYYLEVKAELEKM